MALAISKSGYKTRLFNGSYASEHRLNIIDLYKHFAKLKARMEKLQL